MREKLSIISLYVCVVELIVHLGFRGSSALPFEKSSQSHRTQILRRSSIELFLDILIIVRLKIEVVWRNWEWRRLKMPSRSPWPQLWRMFCSSTRIDRAILISMLAGRRKPVILDLFQLRCEIPIQVHSVFFSFFLHLMKILLRSSCWLVPALKYLVKSIFYLPLLV